MNYIAIYFKIMAIWFLIHHKIAIWPGAISQRHRQQFTDEDQVCHRMPL